MTYIAQPWGKQISLLFCFVTRRSILIIDPLEFTPGSIFFAFFVKSPGRNRTFLSMLLPGFWISETGEREIFRSHAPVWKRVMQITQ